MDHARQLLARVGRWDVLAFDRVARWRAPSALDRGLPALTRAADYSRLWVAVAAGLLAVGRTGQRRAAARGVVSLAVTSLVATQAAKRVHARRRPDLGGVPLRRVARRVPKSSSFPSGHSASAAAFAVGVAVEAPVLAAPVGVLAAAVAFSRVYSGAHFPGDVLAGAALGAGIAAAGVAAVPAHSAALPRPGAEPPRPQPPRPAGEGVVAVVNPRSGSADGLPERLRGLLPAAEIVELHEEDDVAEVCRAAAVRAEVLGVAGGDGTINCAAAAAMAADVPLLVLPGGTFNHFARDLGIETPQDATAALAAGCAVRIDVGEAGGQPFLNTASLGSYPEFVAVRERWEPRLGKPLAAMVALLAVLRSCPPLAAEVDGEPHDVLMLFVGNGRYLPAGFVPRGRARLDSGVLDVRLLDARRGGRLWRAALGAVRGDLRQVEGYRERRAHELTIRSAGSTRLARDGEVADAAEVVRFAVRRQALTVYRCATEG